MRMRQIDTWIFDLDNTLYPASCDLFRQIDTRMAAFIADALGVASAEARTIQKQYYHEHGTTLRGLMLHHGIKPDAYLDYVHDIDLSVLPPAPALDAALAALPGRKLVFTNGSTAHAERVMARLGVDHHFDDVFDIRAADFVPKPEPDAYHRLVGRNRVAADRAALFEDIAANLAPANALGMTTVWVRHAASRAPESDDFIDHVTEDLVTFLTDRVPALRG